MKRARPLVPAAPKPKPKPSKPKPSSARPDALLTVPANGLAATPASSILDEADSPEKPAAFFAWMIAPLSVDEFFASVYETRPAHLKRPAGYNASWFSTAELHRLLRECSLRWTEEVDVTSYRDGARSTLNGDGVADAAEVQRAYADGCSVRLSWPQRHSDGLWAMLAQLEEFFGCGAGCNVYATPAGMQGFAPHWDDIDAFVLQLEGEKHWRLYAARDPSERLPRHSSPDFAQDDLGEPIAHVTLRPGELLYLPRGCIHQAVSGTSDSLHATVSTCRQHSWRDLVELALHGALEEAAAEQLALRRSLPRDFLSFMGVQHAGGGGDDGEAENGGDSGRQRAAFERQLTALVADVVRRLPADAACDQMGRRLMHDRLPPALAPADAPRHLRRPERLTLDCRIRLLSRHAARLAVEEGVAVLYYHTANSRVYHAADDAAHLDFALEAAPALERVLTAYPKWVAVRRLPADDDEQRLDIARALVEARAVLVRRPKPAVGS